MFVAWCPVAEIFFFFKQKTAYEMRISDWSSDVCSSDLLAERQTRGVSFSPGLIDTLRQREVEALGDKLAAETGRQFSKAGTGEYVAGTYRQRFALASGRFAMIDDGLGFQLVPWSPSLERQIGQHVSGVSRGAGGVDWSFGRNRGLGLSSHQTRNAPCRRPKSYGGRSSPSS